MSTPASPAALAEAAWDEAYASDGAPRPAYAPLLRALEGRDLGALSERVVDAVAAAGARFGDHRYAVDPVPRLIEAGEWALLERGLAQRLRALGAFVADVYGAREIVAAGVVPEGAIESAEGYEPALRGRWPSGPAPIGVAGFDVVRTPAGELRVLEDNVRTPSGFAYALVAREAAIAAVGVAGLHPRDPLAPLVAALRATLHDAAAALPRPAEEPRVAVLGDGPDAATAFEHAAAAEWLDAPLLTPGEDLHGVDALYRRTDEDRLTGDDGRPTTVAEALLEPWLAGRLALVNGFGTGVADDKLVHAYVERTIRFYLGEEPLLRSVPTLDLSDADARTAVLDELGRYVVKPRHGQGGHGVVVCAHAERADLERIAAELRKPDAGERWIAQELLPLSTHPTVADGRLEPRHVDLRPYAFATRERVAVPPLALTRVALDRGALVVNSSQDGGAKDTWVLP